MLKSPPGHQSDTLIHNKYRHPPEQMGLQDRHQDAECMCLHSEVSMT